MKHKSYRKLFIGHLQILFHCGIYRRYEEWGKSEGEKGRGETVEGMKKGISVVVLAAILMVSMVGIASAASITWDLDSEEIAAGVYEMEKTGGSGDDGQTGNVSITSGSSVIWRADEAAQCDVYFENETWNGQLSNFSTPGVTDYTVDIGYCDEDGSNFTSNGKTGGHDYFSGGASYFHIEANGFTVPHGTYLALNVTGGSSSMTVYTNETSSVTWPPEDPAYPVPELPTIVLTGAGLLALAGFVGLRRRNK
jgi:MYXO-CTERM domain-containing protein